MKGQAAAVRRDGYAYQFAQAGDMPCRDHTGTHRLEAQINPALAYQYRGCEVDKKGEQSLFGNGITISEE